MGLENSGASNSEGVRVTTLKEMKRVITGPYPVMAEEPGSIERLVLCPYCWGKNHAQVVLFVVWSGTNVKSIRRADHQYDFLKGQLRVICRRCTHSSYYSLDN